MCMKLNRSTDVKNVFTFVNVLTESRNAAYLCANRAAVSAGNVALLFCPYGLCHFNTVQINEPTKYTYNEQAHAY